MIAAKGVALYQCLQCGTVIQEPQQRSLEMNGVGWIDLLARSTIVHECVNNSSMKLYGVAQFRGFRMETEGKKP